MTAMEELIEQARRDGKWLHCAYQDLWWSPDELARENANGRFNWGPINFALRDPNDYMHKLRQCVITAQRDVENFEERMRATGVQP